MANRKHTTPPAAQEPSQLQELEKQLPFRNKRGTGFIAQGARSTARAYDAESFESLRERIQKRLALTEAEASREARSQRSKKAWARKQCGVTEKDQLESRT